MKDLILIGGGAHCIACIELIELNKKYNILGIVDTKENVGKKVLGYEIIGNDEDIAKLYSSHLSFLITIGNPLLIQKRKEVFNFINRLGGIFISIHSPFSYVSKSATIHPGSVILHNSTISNEVNIGTNSIIGCNVCIEHNVSIGPHSIMNSCTSIRFGSYFPEMTHVKNN